MSNGTNYSLAVLLLNPNCRAVKGIYEPDPPKDSGKPQVRREWFKTFDKTVAVGDLVVVPSYKDHKFSTIRVTDVDCDDWDPAMTENVRWIVSKIDTSVYDKLLAAEEETIEFAKGAEKAAKRDELKKKMFAHMDERQTAQLAIASGASPTPTSGTAGIDPVTIDGDKS